tara:strand:- start:777 stop:1064 length:288 start_codon:yes stop_codon:yes gene_type:complete
MIYSNNLYHVTTQKNILNAMRDSMRQNVAHVRNKKGNAYIAVRYIKCRDGVKRFEFTDKKGNNIARTMGRGLVLENYSPLARILVNYNAYGMYLK